jgi:hypothetical protein
VSTVKSHVASIYPESYVAWRREAVRKARGLNLVWNRHRASVLLPIDQNRARVVESSYVDRVR